MRTQLQRSVSPEEARAIAKEAYIYGFPLVENYRIQHSYFVDQDDPDYKAPWNTIYNDARVYTSEDRAVQCPDTDTSHSYAGIDLRPEPVVLTVPAIDNGRFYHIQLVDMYTHNFAYVGTRTTGNYPGSFLLVGPSWKGDKPTSFRDVIRCETDFAFALYRTQLFSPTDISNVKKIQAGYKIQTLSDFAHRRDPPTAPLIDFKRPLAVDVERASLEFFDLLNSILEFCPTHLSEVALMDRFSKIGIGPGYNFDADSVKPEFRKAIDDGIADAWRDFKLLKTKLDAGEVTSEDLFGSREHLKNNYLYRMLATVNGIYGNSFQEAIYPSYRVNSEGKAISGRNAYTLRFPPNKLPPVNAFWSLTLYELPSQLLSANPLNRHLINSAMLPKLKLDHDGGLTLYIQHKSPGANKESNWLPAPKGKFFVALRLYSPKAAAFDGSWTKPALERVPVQKRATTTSKRSSSIATKRHAGPEKDGIYFATGIENSIPKIDNGRTRVDEMESCGHYEKWTTDFDKVEELGLSFLRYGPPLHKTFIAPGKYDWSFADTTFADLKRRKIIPIVDLCHFGVPDWIGDFQNPDFPELFEQYAGEFAMRFPWVQVYTPVNEMYICSLFSARYGWWNEQLTSEQSFVTALKHVVKANLLAMKAILKHRPDAIFVQSESTEYFHPVSPDAIAPARVRNSERFVTLDLTYGHPVDSETYQFLMDNGMTQEEYRFFLGQKLRYACIMGNDYYWTNEHLVYPDGNTGPSGEVFGYGEITNQYFQRYRLPVMHTETNFWQGPRGDEAVLWLRKQWANILQARVNRVPIVGFTWYSLTDQVDWDTALREKNGHVNPLGLYDLDRNVRPVGEAYKQLIKEWREYLSTETVCLTVPIAFPE